MRACEAAGAEAGFYGELARFGASGLGVWVRTAFEAPGVLAQGLEGAAPTWQVGLRVSIEFNNDFFDACKHDLVRLLHELAALGPRGFILSFQYEHVYATRDARGLAIAEDSGLVPMAGEAAPPWGRVDEDNSLSIQRKNDALQRLPAHGYDVEFLPNAALGEMTNPDAAIGGQLADVYSPGTGSLSAISDLIAKRVELQAPNVVLNLDHSPLSPAQVHRHLLKGPMLYSDVILVKSDDDVVVVVR